MTAAQAITPPSLAARRNMILGQLFTNDITDKRILQAMAGIPREPFLPESLRGAAYIDEDLEVDNGRYLMAPLTFARLIALADITPTCRVLNIGCLDGYSAAILSKLAYHVVGTELDTEAVSQANVQMSRLNIHNVDIEQVISLADGYKPRAPYDVIVVQGAVGFIPEALGAQLAPGGRLVAVRNIAMRPDFKGGLGKCLLLRRLDNRLQYRESSDASATLLPGFEREEGFTF